VTVSGIWPVSLPETARRGVFILPPPRVNSMGMGAAILILAIIR